MKKEIEINGKTYAPIEIDFNVMCTMEDMGVSIFDGNSKGLSSIRAYFALMSGLSLADAGNELYAHMKSGHSFDELTDAFTNAVRDAINFMVAPTEKPKAAKKATKEEA